MIDFNMTIKVTHIVYDTTDNEDQYLDMDLPTELVFDIDGDSDDIEYIIATNDDTATKNLIFFLLNCFLSFLRYCFNKLIISLTSCSLISQFSVEKA